VTHQSCREDGALRILVADSRPDVRSALKLLVEQDAGMVVSSEARRGGDVLEQVKATCPDVIILDCDLPGLQAGDLLRAVRTVCPCVWVVALCSRSEARRAALVPLRDRLLDDLPRLIERVLVTGSRTDRLPHHASVCVEFVEGEGMLLFLDMSGIAASSGSACTSKALKASHVLLAMGFDHATAQGSLVFSLVHPSAGEDVDALLEAFPPIVDRLRKMSPLYTAFLKERGS